MAQSCSNRSWIEISTSAFFHNSKIIASSHSHNRIILCLKANAYGHGFELMAKLADQNEYIESLCISDTIEQTALQALGIKKNSVIHPQSEVSSICTGPEVYGILTNSHHQNLAPLLIWKTKLFRIKKTGTGCSIGYACTYKTLRPTTIGILPIGYADGIPRSLSNKGVAILYETLVPFIGIVSMNLITIDVTDVHQAKPADIVTLIKTDKSLITMAQQAQMTPIELVCRIPQTIKRFPVF